MKMWGKHRRTRTRARPGPSIGSAGRISWNLIAATQAILLMMVFGGPIPGLAVTVLIAVSALILIAGLPFVGDGSHWQEQPLGLRVGLVGIALLPLAQLVPMPPDLWHSLPGQVVRLRVLDVAGLSNTWQPLSVTPLATAGSAVIAIAFVALVAFLLELSVPDLRRIAWLILAIVAVNVLIGLVQVSTGGQALLFYAASDKGAFLGFFANKNHAAFALAASLPVAAYALGARHHPKGARTWLALYAGVVLIAIVTTNSRAGLGLGLMALLVLGSLYVRRVRPIYVLGIAALVIVATVVVSTTSAFETVFSRFNDVDQDLRWQFLWSSWPLIRHYWLWGSGIGSFSTLYAANEPLALVKPTYVNQLHNEYPQLLLEAGIAGVALLVLLIASCLWRGAHLWRDPTARLHRLPLACGALIIVLVAFHSGVDYPLRRPAALPLLALALVLVIRADVTASTGLSRPKQRA